jgi:hypothetical protein
MSDEFADEQAYDLAEAFGLPDRLPPLRLPPEPELAEVARTSGLLARARGLATWVGSARDAEDGYLTAADSAAATTELGVDRVDQAHLWQLLEVLDFVEFDEPTDRVSTGSAIEDWPTGDDAQVLEVWDAALGHVVADYLPLEAELDEDTALVFDGAAGAAIVGLFLTGSSGVPVDEVSELVQEIAIGELPPETGEQEWAAWLAKHGDPGRALLDRMHDLGAAEFVDDDVRLTPLGMYVFRNQMQAGGIEVPLLPPVEEMTAADLVAAAEGFTPEELAAESGAWLALRGAEDATRDLLAVAAEGDPTDRVFATSIASGLDAPAPWREVLDHQALRPYAKVALGETPELTDLAWLLTDLLAAMDDPDDADAITTQFAEAVPVGQEEPILDAMWRLPHPDVSDVLEMIGEHHPDKSVAKAARRAAHKAASRHNT